MFEITIYSNQMQLAHSVQYTAYQVVALHQYSMSRGTLSCLETLFAAKPIGHEVAAARVDP